MTLLNPTPPILDQVVKAEWNGDELQRYQRQMQLPEIGERGQSRLRAARLLVIGAGALGSAAAYYLTAAGVGRLTIVDGDRVDYSNLQRQILHSTADVGRLKVESARDKLTALNPNVAIKTVAEMFDRDNAMPLLRDTDFVIDATDNHEAKFLINDICVAAGVPFSIGAISRFSGQATTWIKGAPCYRCLFPDPPAKEPFAGPFGAVPGVVGSIQAAEAIKFVAGVGELLTGRLLTIDLLTMRFATFTFCRDRSCKCCSRQ